MGVTREVARTTPWLAGLVWAALLMACDEGRIFEPAGEQFTITLMGALTDGRDLEGNPVAGSVGVFRSDRATPIMVDDDNVIEVDADGSFQANFEAFLTDSIIVLVATSGPPFLPASKAVRVGSGPASAELYVSSTLITGHVEGLDGRPAEVDIWVMRDDGSGMFVPYEIAGGRDFIPPVPLSGMKFGIDTDRLGDFAIPVRVPDAQFRLVFVVDRETDKFASLLTDLFVASGQANRVPDITLQPASPPPSRAQ